MRRLVKNKPGEGFDFESDAKKPTPTAGELLIKCQYVAICGSDINLYKWNDIAKQIAKLPFTPGHEMTGVVDQIGDDVEGFEVGDRIAVENHYYCDNCVICKKKRGDICMNMSQYGHGKGTEHGGFSDFSIVPAKYAYKLKKDITPVQAVLMEPMGVVHNIIEQIEVGEGDEVLVIGAGAIGCLAVNICKALGAKKVYATDIVQNRLDLAIKMGADGTINGLEQNLHDEMMRLTDNNGIQKIIECSGVPMMLTNCMKYLQKGGYLGLVGLPKTDIVFKNPIHDFVFKSLTVKTVHGRRIFHTWEECEKLIADGKCKPELCVTHEFNLKDYEECFAMLFSGKACKIVVKLN